MLGGGGGIVVATARTIADSGGDIISDMSKDQIVNAIRDGKTVILTIIRILEDFNYQEICFMTSGFIIYYYDAMTDSLNCNALVGGHIFTLSDDNIWQEEFPNA